MSLSPELQQAIDDFAEALYDEAVAKEGPERKQYYRSWKDCDEGTKDLWRLTALERAQEARAR